jgi:hypothetical protein
LTVLKEGLLSAATLGHQVRGAGLEDPCDWSFELDPELTTTAPEAGGTLPSASATQDVR